LNQTPLVDIRKTHRADAVIATILEFSDFIFMHSVYSQPFSFSIQVYLYWSFDDDSGKKRVQLS